MSVISLAAKPFLKKLHGSIDGFNYESIYNYAESILKSDGFSDEERKVIWENISKVINDHESKE